MAKTFTSYQDETDHLDDDYAPAMGARFPIYKHMGDLTLSASGGEGPLVAMARAIQDDAEFGGSYIVRMGAMTISMSVELQDGQA